MFRRIFVITLLCVATLGLSNIQTGRAKPSATDSRQKDERAILETIDRWDQGWKAFDAELAARDYAADAEWTNAFGHSRRGKVEIFEYLAKIYQNPAIRSRTSTPSKTSIRFLGTDVAAASSYRETVGQKTPSGAEYPTRKTHDLRVLARANGRWAIVSHLIMDEKETKP